MRLRSLLTSTNLIALGLVSFAVVARFLPHPPNFAPIAAIALFSGVYLSKRASLVVPLVAMILSDVFLGMHSTVAFTWSGMILIGLIGWAVRRRKTFTTVALGALSGSVVFFLLTNFGVWLAGNMGMYPRNFSGLLEAYVMGVPFFRNTLAGDLFYVAVFFGVAELALQLERRRTRSMVQA